VANINRPTGFKPVRQLDGSPYNGASQLYFIATSDANAYAVGDLVTQVGTTNSSDLYALGVPIVTRLTGTEASQPSALILGSIVGFKVDPTNLQNSGYNPASNANGRYVWVSDAPQVIYEVQLCGAAGAAIAPNLSAVAGTNYIGMNAEIYNPGATANGGAGLSNMQVDASTVAVTATYPVKILRYSMRIDQDLSTAGVYPKVEVLINSHALSNNAIVGI